MVAERREEREREDGGGRRGRRANGGDKKGLEGGMTVELGKRERERGREIEEERES